MPGIATIYWLGRSPATNIERIQERLGVQRATVREAEAFAALEQLGLALKPASTSSTPRMSTRGWIHRGWRI